MQRQLQYSGQKIQDIYTAIDPAGFWYRPNPTLASLPAGARRQLSHSGRIMEVPSMGVQVFGNDRCDLCVERNRECWAYSEFGKNMISRAGDSCVRCRLSLRKTGCSFATATRAPRVRNPANPPAAQHVPQQPLPLFTPTQLLPAQPLPLFTPTHVLPAQPTPPSPLVQPLPAQRLPTSPDGQTVPTQAPPAAEGLSAQFLPADPEVKMELCEESEDLLRFLTLPIAPVAATSSFTSGAAFASIAYLLYIALASSARPRTSHLEAKEEI